LAPLRRDDLRRVTTCTSTQFMVLMSRHASAASAYDVCAHFCDLAAQVRERLQAREEVRPHLVVLHWPGFPVSWCGGAFPGSGDLFPEGALGIIDIGASEQARLQMLDLIRQAAPFLLWSVKK
jgi:hypothetical protein